MMQKKRRSSTQSRRRKSEEAQLGNLFLEDTGIALDFEMPSFDFEMPDFEAPTLDALDKPETITKVKPMTEKERRKLSRMLKEMEETLERRKTKTEAELAEETPAQRAALNCMERLVECWKERLDKSSDGGTEALETPHRG